MRKGTRNHGYSLKYPAEFHAWKNAIHRCHSRKSHAWKNYGGRGIRVCDRWRERNGVGFANFLADVGVRPSDRHSIDRIDNAKGYEPGNVRWATRDVQSLNRRTTKVTPDIARMVVAFSDAGLPYWAAAQFYGISITQVYRTIASFPQAVAS